MFIRRPYHKYGATREKRGDRSFASKLEAALFDELSYRQGQGDISDLKCQVQVFLTDARIVMKPDFSFIEEGELIYAEAKGFETSDWRIKRRLWTVYGPGPLRIYKGSARHLTMVEEIIPRR